MSDTESASKNKDVQLTREAKEAVRGYMLTLVAIPTVALTIISAAAGFFINQVAYQEGYNKAYEAAIADVVKASAAVASAQAQADVALKTMNDAISRGQLRLDQSLQDAKNVSDDAQQTSQRASILINKNTEQLAADLAKTETFQNAAATVLAPAIGRLTQQMESLTQVLGDVSKLEKEGPFKICRFLPDSRTWADTVVFPKDAPRERCHEWAQGIVGGGNVEWELGCIGKDKKVSRGGRHGEPPEDNYCGW